MKQKILRIYGVYSPDDIEAHLKNVTNGNLMVQSSQLIGKDLIVVINKTVTLKSGLSTLRNKTSRK